MVLAQFRQDVGKRVGRKVGELVEVADKIDPLLLRHFYPPHRRLLHRVDEQRAEQIGGVFAEQTFGQPGDDDLLRVHRFAKA